MQEMLLSPITLNAFLLGIRQEFDTTVRNILRELPPSTPSPSKEFLTEPESREFLGGISRHLFNNLRKAEKFKTYYCGESRLLFSREELVTYLKTNKPNAK